MAGTNSTQAFATSGFPLSAPAGIHLPELEKISCSFSPFSGIEPLGLLGRCVQVQHRQEFSDQVHCYGAFVIAYQAGSVAHGIESQLLLRPDDGSDDEYVEISRLSILAVFS